MSETSRDYIAENELFEDLVSKLSILSKNTEEQDCIDQLKRVFLVLIEELTTIGKMQFSTLFSKVSYAANTYGIQGSDLYLTHVWRRYVEQNSIDDSYDPIQLGLYINTLWVRKASPEVDVLNLDAIQRPKITRTEERVVGYSPFEYFIALQINTEKEAILGYTEQEPHIFKTVLYNQAGRNDTFTKSIKEAEQYMQLPLMLGLHHCQIADDGSLSPESIIIDPDYLLDVTAVSECFASGSTNTMGHLTKKFIPVEPNIHLMLGNVANMMLDELITAPDANFESLRTQIFGLHPLALSQFSDEEAINLLSKSKQHFHNLKKVINEQFYSVEIDRDYVYLEPSFYSSHYGLQGRLDLFHQNTEKEAFDIVELKSGKPFKPNAYGLNHNHYVQTILYELLTRHTLPKRVKSKAYILYSSQEVQALKYAPVLKSQQQDALQVRNTIRSIEYLLAQIDQEGALDIFSFLNPESIPSTWRYVKRDLNLIKSMISQLDEIDYSYFKQFVGLIAREHLIAKTGVSTGENRNGFAALWSESLEQKKESYSSIVYNTIHQIEKRNGRPVITLHINHELNGLSRFRNGDIVVLYPHIESTTTTLVSQVFKCTILNIQQGQIELQLRNQQQNLNFFEEYTYWHLDPDLLDSSFNSMYRSLYSFFTSDKRKQQLVLGRTPPEDGKPYTLRGTYDITDNQKEVIEKALSAEDYYLIWGPPGTGKTSKVLATIANELVTYQNKITLVIAFTNRAVDEISHAILSQDIAQHHILRIGSKHSTHSDFAELLLSARMESIKTRKALNELLSQTKIVIGTASSILGKKGLFEILDFDTIIVDEASQLLEPMLLGILPKAKKWILIGDHQQLPAVVTQSMEASQVQDQQLHDALALSDTRNSLFERLMSLSDRNDWDIYGILTEQGRMHQDIMHFVNTQFYDGQLERILSLEMLTQSVNQYATPTLPQRMHFIQCNSESDFTLKQNVNQAETLITILQEYETLFASFSHQPSIGVITPFRAQIALINQLIERSQLSLTVNVDTVERYQGGARDIIIYSTVVNHPLQLRQIVSLSAKGIDRKLNVAITRARAVFICLGDSNVLNREESYAKLLDYVKTLNKSGSGI